MEIRTRLKQLAILLPLVGAGFAFEPFDADRNTNLQQKAATGDMQAQEYLALEYYYTALQDGFKQNAQQLNEKCVYWARKATGAGSVLGAFLLGESLYYGRGTAARQDVGLTVMYYSAIRGYATAQLRYARIISTNSVSSREDLLQAAGVFLELTEDKDFRDEAVKALKGLKRTHDFKDAAIERARTQFLSLSKTIPELKRTHQPIEDTICAHMEYLDRISSTVKQRSPIRLENVKSR